MINHTPGPWFVRKWDGEEWPDRRISIGPESNGTAIAVSISPRYCDIQQMEADAQLIAAAPELLEALTKCVEIMSNGGTWTIEDQHTALAAIAKATGEQQ